MTPLHRMSEKNLETFQGLCNDWRGKPLRLMFQDETRFGRINDVRHCADTQACASFMPSHSYPCAHLCPRIVRTSHTGTMDALIQPQVNTLWR